MDFDEYVAARYGRLIEQAVLLGCPEGEAGTYVDRVLVAQRRRIRRAKDPDPLVHEALEREVAGEPPRRRKSGPVAAVGLVAGVAVVGVIATYQPAPATETMPSLFGYDATGATTYLEHHGLAVQIDKVQACEPLGQVVGSQPEPGVTVEKGTTVHVRTSLPGTSFCIPDYDDRVDAWTFVRFALGGAPPRFGPTVDVYTAGSAGHRELTAAQATEPGEWSDVLGDVAAAAHRTVSSVSGMAQLGVESAVPPAHYCGYDQPVALAGRTALRLTIDTSADGTDQCPLTVDLYRQDRRIVAVVVYPT